MYKDVAQILQQWNSWIRERVILTSKNDQAAAINKSIPSVIERNEFVHTSINTVLNQNDATNYPVEFLDSPAANGLPTHQLALKVGVSIMLLQNYAMELLLNLWNYKKESNRGQCGTMICGPSETIFIPRMPLILSNFSFQFKRI